MHRPLSAIRQLDHNQLCTPTRRAINDRQGVADWHGREAIRQNLRDFIDKGLTAHHDVVEYLDSPLHKVFHGKVRMTFDDPAIPSARPTMTHFFYMDEQDPTKVSRWVGAVGPTGF